MTGKQLTIVSINGPYRDEGVFTMMRLAHAAKEKGITVNFFNYLDATIIAHKDQAPKEFPPIETIFGTIVKKGIKKPKAACYCMHKMHGCKRRNKTADRRRHNRRAL